MRKRNFELNVLTSSIESYNRQEATCNPRFVERQQSRRADQFLTAAELRRGSGPAAHQNNVENAKSVLYSTASAFGTPDEWVMKVVASNVH